MAEAILSKLGAGKFYAYSAGSYPKGHAHPETLRLLQALGYNTSGLRSKSWSQFAPADHRRSKGWQSVQEARAIASPTPPDPSSVSPFRLTLLRSLEVNFFETSKGATKSLHNRSPPKPISQPPPTTYQMLVSLFEKQPGHKQPQAGCNHRNNNHQQKSLPHQLLERAGYL
jgi:hypothetical protein